MRTLIAVLLTASSVWAQASQGPTRTVPSQGPPPKNLSVRPDGHVSANQDPVNADKFEYYAVKQGDTLSAIAGEVLKNPRLWPQLWELNEHIVNPHWIYPNDVVLIKPVTLITEVKPEPEPPTPPPAPEPEPPRRATPLPPPAPPVQPPAQQILIVDQQKPATEIKYTDLYCSGQIRTADVSEALNVITKFDATSGVLASEAEYVYLSQGAEDGIQTGQVYQVIRPTRTITNPYVRGDHKLGRHFLDVAQVRVVVAQPDFSIARVVFSCGDAIIVGDLLVPFERIVVPMPPRPRTFSPTMTTNTGIRGMIVTTQNALLNFGSTFPGAQQIPGVRGSHLGSIERGVAGEGMIVYIDIGPNSAVNPGDIFIVYREVDIDDGYSAFRDMSRNLKKLRNARRAVGEVVVVRVGERAATALVTYALDGLEMGDLVERR